MCPLGSAQESPLWPESTSGLLGWVTVCLALGEWARHGQEAGPGKLIL